MKHARNARDQILVALDVPTLSQALTIATELRDYVGGFKIGLELLSSEGSRQVVESISSIGRRIFYDAKFSDIPNTVGAATKAVAEMGVWMLNIHASCGLDSMRACVANRGKSLVVAVTILTSLQEGAVVELFGAPAKEKVLQFGSLAATAGANGIVCSALELAELKNNPITKDLLAVVPGVRPEWAESGDQARVMTPGEAVAAGADFVVIGRPILRPPDSIGSRRNAAENIASEIERRMEKRTHDFR